MAIGCFTYQELDNSIYWAIRKTIEAKQYSPPINSYQPETPATRAAFIAAAAALETSTGNKFIRLIGNGFSKHKGGRAANTIYISRVSGTEGTVSHNNDYIQQNVTGTQFSQFRVSGSTKILTYEIRLLSESVAYENIMRELINTTLTSGRKQLPLLIDTNYVEDTDRMYLLEYTGDNKPFSDFTEVVYTFDVIDIWIVGSTTTVTTTIPQLVRVDGLGNTTPNNNDDIDLTN